MGKKATIFLLLVVIVLFGGACQNSAETYTPSPAVDELETDVPQSTQMTVDALETDVPQNTQIPEDLSVYLEEVTGPAGDVFQTRGYSIAFSPDGNMLATVSGDGISIWRVSDWTLRHQLSGGSGEIVFSPDSKKLVSASYDATLRIWDTEEGILLNLLQVPLYTRPKSRILRNSNARPPGFPMVPSNYVLSVAYSPDGSRIAVGTEGGAIFLWDTETLKSAGKFLEGPAPASSLAFTPDSKQLVSGRAGGEIIIWDMAEGAITQQFMTHNLFTNMGLSADGARIGSASGKGFAGVWGMDGKNAYTFALDEPGGYVSSVQFSPNDKIIVAGTGIEIDEGSLWIWGADTGALLYKLENLGHLSSLSFSPDGQWLAITAAGDVIIYRVVMDPAAEPIPRPSPVPTKTSTSPDAHYPTATPIAFFDFDIESILLLPGDLPPQYFGTVVSDELPDTPMLDLSTLPDRVVALEIERNEDGGSGMLAVVMFFADTRDMAFGEISHKLQDPQIIFEFDDLAMMGTEDVGGVRHQQVLFVRCNALVYLNTTADTLKYAQNLDERLAALICP